MICAKGRILIEPGNSLFCFVGDNLIGDEVVELIFFLIIGDFINGDVLASFDFDAIVLVIEVVVVVVGDDVVFFVIRCFSIECEANFFVFVSIADLFSFIFFKVFRCFIPIKFFVILLEVVEDFVFNVVDNSNFFFLSIAIMFCICVAFIIFVAP